MNEELDLREDTVVFDSPLGDTRPIPDLKSITVPPQEVAAVPAEVEAPEEKPVAGLDGSTIRLDQLPDLNASFVAAQEAAMEKETPKIEPFSETWEPEYDDPMGEYIPPAKVIEHPRSMMRDIKRKLVAGPEKRYYELSASGTGKLQAAMFLTLVLVALSAGAAGEGSVPMYKADLTGPAAIVIGNEGDGLSQLVRKNCDMLIHIPMAGRISSLNASAAASILLYEAVRQRLG